MPSPSTKTSQRTSRRQPRNADADSEGASMAFYFFIVAVILSALVLVASLMFM